MESGLSYHPPNTSSASKPDSFASENPSKSNRERNLLMEIGSFIAANMFLRSFAPFTWLFIALESPFPPDTASEISSGIFFMPTSLTRAETQLSPAPSTAKTSKKLANLWTIFCGHAGFTQQTMPLSNTFNSPWQTGHSLGNSMFDVT